MVGRSNRYQRGREGDYLLDKEFGQIMIEV